MINYIIIQKQVYDEGLYGNGRTYLQWFGMMLFAARESHRVKGWATESC